ncbi:MAG: Uma2 family endonuclease [Xenococcaceae cyanobacterium MO_188.B29]|nr:Uma2 family endonuclease [Xenococcaceae cyanobacterium MO_188.B29]
MVNLAKWSIVDYHKMIEAGILRDRNIQLIDGELVEMSPEGVIHAAYGGSVADYLRQVLVGKAWIREAHPIILANSEPEPDIAIVKLPKSKYFQNHPTPQDIFWLIEISDTTLAYDLGKKKEIYALGNIQEYWILDVKDKQLIVFTKPRNKNYLAQVELSAGLVKPAAFADIAISIAKLFEE